jgi:hypothetical protein
VELGDERWGGMTNPMTTDGDLIRGVAGGAPVRIAKGSNGQVLKMVGGIPAWGTDAGVNHHDDLLGTHYSDCHPIGAITGLQSALNSIGIKTQIPANGVRQDINIADGETIHVFGGFGGDNTGLTLDGARGVMKTMTVSNGGTVYENISFSSPFNFSGTASFNADIKFSRIGSSIVVSGVVGRGVRQVNYIVYTIGGDLIGLHRIEVTLASGGGNGLFWRKL